MTFAFFAAVLLLLELRLAGLELEQLLLDVKHVEVHAFFRHLGILTPGTWESGTVGGAPGGSEQAAYQSGSRLKPTQFPHAQDPGKRDPEVPDTEPLNMKDVRARSSKQVC